MRANEGGLGQHGAFRTAAVWRSREQEQRGEGSHTGADDGKRRVQGNCGQLEVREECSGMREASHDQGLGDKVTGVMREKSMHGMGCLRGRNTGVVVMI